jgi:hypothetical protein
MCIKLLFFCFKNVLKLANKHLQFKTVVWGLLPGPLKGEGKGFGSEGGIAGEEWRYGGEGGTRERDKKRKGKEV